MLPRDWVLANPIKFWWEQQTTNHLTHTHIKITLFFFFFFLIIEFWVQFWLNVLMEIKEEWRDGKGRLGDMSHNWRPTEDLPLFSHILLTPSIHAADSGCSSYDPAQLWPSLSSGAHTHKQHARTQGSMLALYTRSQTHSLTLVQKHTHSHSTRQRNTRRTCAFTRSLSHTHCIVSSSSYDTLYCIIVLHPSPSHSHSLAHVLTHLHTSSLTCTRRPSHTNARTQAKLIEIVKQSRKELFVQQEACRVCMFVCV